MTAKSTLHQYMELRRRRMSMIELLITLILMLVSSPFLVNLVYGRVIEALLLTSVLVMAVVVVGASRNSRITAIVLAIPTVLGRWANHFRPDLLPSSVYLIAGLLFVGFVIVHLLRFTLTAQRVNSEVLYAAISNFLMIGLFWVFAYDLAATFVPDSFAYSTGPAASHTLSGFNGFYFSFVTLSTIGYGDITPLSPVARMLAIVEAIVGMFYMTVLVARLVAMYSSGKSE
jgi:voltage-gated potassium channel